MIKQWFKSGNPWIWLTAGAVSVSLILVFGLLLLIAARGLGHFWPATLVEYDYQDQNQDHNIVRLIGEIHDEEAVGAQRLRDAGFAIEGDADVTRYLLKTGNRDVTGMDFRWVLETGIQAMRTPETLMTVERREWGNLYGYLQTVQENQQTVAEGQEAWDSLQQRMTRVTALFKQIRELEKGDIGTINYGLERVRLRERGLELDNSRTG